MMVALQRHMDPAREMAKEMQRIGKVENFKGTDQDFEEWDLTFENYLAA